MGRALRRSATYAANRRRSMCLDPKYDYQQWKKTQIHGKVARINGTMAITGSGHRIQTTFPGVFATISFCVYVI